MPRTPLPPSPPQPSSLSPAERHARMRALRAQRPKQRLATATLWFFGIAAGVACGSLSWTFGRMFAPADQPGMLRFLTQDAKPFPLREEGSSWSDLGPWLWKIWDTMGREALWTTLAIAVAASALAGLFGLLIAPLTNQKLMSRRPYELGAPHQSAKLASLMRSLCVAMRGIPEYILAFLLITLLTQSVWPAILALAIHNGGILGRLFGETLEDVRSRPMEALTGVGAKRSGLWLVGGAPQAFNRWLAFFFYRVEPCVREATVLGMLGIISIGYYVKELRAMQFYDELIVLVVLGAALVMAADWVSGWVRGRLRK